MTGTRGNKSRWRDGRLITLALTVLAWAIYAIAFRAASFSWFNAIGAAGASVIPGAIAAGLAWVLQPRLKSLKLAATTVSHVGLTLLTIGVWLSLMLTITWVAQPEAFDFVLRNATPGTILSGLTLYAAVAFIHALVAARDRDALHLTALAKANLKALRARTEPHFLYNTLETIAGLVRSDPTGAEDAISRLGRLLRSVLDEDENGDALVPLTDELRLVRDYLAIEKLRMGERLSIIECVDERASDLAVPRFLIQALVENAIIHGLSPKREGGTVSLSVGLEDKRLALVVADDGVGGDEQTIREGGLGLSLIKQRLDLHYAGAAQFDVATSPGRGASVHISTPAVEAD